ncbi:putative RNA methyltransferase [Williamsia maris]|uniref:23S rRNA (Guanine745-N1)-methyltransferase n=1 Tax=Williamsia maris TaxID=72806 RepID=A0ABT1HGA9_9NOCA|nr:methyltransferase domain-containing protein [Williamsia maris]MCP2177276.1 23S rRNA (guanine745-N1)-methyltransferase [Williamsia maris]
MLSAIIDLLDCPVCQGDLDIDESTVICDRGHTFDIARQGYVSLLSGSAGKLHSDSVAMVSARERVLGSGLYDPISDAVAELTLGPVTLDVGAGTGHHLARCLAAVGPDARGVGLDLSKAGARAIARAHPRIGSVIADAWQRLPLRDDTVDTVLSVFAPRNVAEFARVLVPGGALVVVTPTPRHLAEIVEPMGMIGVDPAKPERIGNTLGAAFTRTERISVDHTMTLDRALVADIVTMGPSAYHLSENEITDRAEALPDTVDVACSVTVSRYEANRPA